jgi:deazaflavin-dependent oxidoreductase (nitroreductase family)
MNATTEARYIRPDWFTHHVFNRLIAGLAKVGVSAWGARRLHVRKRFSGDVQTVPVNLLTVDGHAYLVAPRGATQWVRNLRAAGEATLSVGRRSNPFAAVEIDDADKAPILREYLRRWGFEVSKFFEGVDPKNVSLEQLAELAPGIPVFRVS